MKKILLTTVLVFAASCAPPLPEIKIAEIADPTEKMTLASEITKRLIGDGLGYPILLVKAEKKTVLDDILAQKIDVSLFVENASSQGVPGQCSSVSNEAVSLGQSIEEQQATKVVRCDLSSKAKDLFEMISQLKLDEGDIDDALFWKDDNHATLAQTALYFLNNNQPKWKLWVSDSGVQNIRALIRKETEASKLQF